MDPELLNYYKARGAFYRRRGAAAESLLGPPPEAGMRSVSPMEWLFQRYLMEPEQYTGMRAADILAPQAAALSDINELEYYLREPALSGGERAMLRGAQGLAALGAIPFLGTVNPTDDAARIAAAKAAKQAAREAKERARTAWLSKFPELGQKFGPRKGFYSKLERAIRDMPGASMPTEEFRKYLKKAGISQAELDNYDIDTLLTHSGGKVQREDLADWSLRRRPAYTETRRMGTERSWEAARAASEGERTYDYDRFNEWRQDRTDALVDNDMNYYQSYVEQVQDEDGEITGYRLYNHDGEEIDLFDTEEAANRARIDRDDGQREQLQEYYDQQTDNTFVRDYGGGNALSAEELMEEEGWYEIEPSTTEPRYAGDPGEDPTDPLYAERHGRWGTSHYSPGATDRETDPYYMELIQQMQPIGRRHAAALQDELGTGTLPSPPAPNPLMAGDLLAEPPSWRQAELERIPERAKQDWRYTTHWEELNPVEHIRGYYDAPELQEVIPPGLRGKPLSQSDSTLQDFLEAGYTSRVDVVPDDNGQLAYEMTLFNPEGDILTGPTTIWSAPNTPGGRGGRWDYTGERGRDVAIERYVNNQLERFARQDIPRYNQAIGYDERPRYGPTGRRGLYVSEMQADLEQQSKRDYYPFRTPPPKSREERIAELRARGMDVQPVPVGITVDELYENSLRGADWSRLERLPEWRDYLDALPASQAERLERLRMSLVQGEASAAMPGSTRVNALNAADEIRQAAEAAGVPMEYLPPESPRPPPVYQYGQMRERTTRAPSPVTPDWSDPNDQFTLPMEAEWGNQIQQPYFAPHSFHGGYPTEAAAWDAALADQPEQILSGSAPQFPLTDDRYQLAMKRALLEAAHTDQDFVAWNTPEVMHRMNAERGATLFPQLYGEKGYLATGSAAKAAGLKGTATPVTLDYPDPYTHAPRMQGYKIDLTPEIRQRIKDEGFSMWQFLPYLAAPAGAAGVLGYWEDPRDDTY